MGQVIIVPSALHFETPTPGNSNSGLSMPVMFNTGSYGAGGISAMVNLPPNPTVFHNYDPLKAHIDYYTFGAEHPNHMIHSLTYQQFRRAFWDRYELERLVGGFYGDLLLQIESDINASYPKWNFAPTDGRDTASVVAIMNRTKSHHVRVHNGLRADVESWLRENCVHRYSYEKASHGEDEVFIEDESEAIHFKMKWFGEKPEVEEDDVPF